MDETTTVNLHSLANISTIFFSFSLTRNYIVVKF